MPEELTEEDVYHAWNDDFEARKRPELDEAPLLEAAASALAVSSASQPFKSGFSTPSTTVDAQKGSGYATPRQSHNEIRQSQLVFPASHYDGWKPPMPPTLEDELAEELLSEDCDTEYQMVSVSNFRMYRPPAPDRKFANLEGEMEPLHVLRAKRGCNSLLFDGTIATTRGKKYVQGVPFETLAIDAYVPDLPSAAGRISIQSISASETRLWYLLDGSPSSEYERYHHAFLWVADLTKHTVDFMRENDNVTLADFQHKFYLWIMNRHGRKDSGPFQDWISQYQSKDFRKPVVAHAEFIWKECFSLSVNNALCKEPLWKDINHNQDKTKLQEERTVVTPYVFQNFTHTPFNEYLEAKGVTASLMRHAMDRKVAMGFHDADEAQTSVSSTTRAISESQVTNAGLEVRKGDCIAVWPDEISRWTDGASLWYAYVQDVLYDNEGEHYKVLWLYEPRQTEILSKRRADGDEAAVRYPYPNELFLSDNCNCGMEETRKKDVVNKVAVNFMTGQASINPSKSKGRFEYFVRQKYDVSERCFMTIKDADFHCTCQQSHSVTKVMEDFMLKYSPGDVILAPSDRCVISDMDSQSKSKDEVVPKDGQQIRQQLLDPFVIVKLIPKRHAISVRTLLRRNRDLKDVKARPNELVWTNKICRMPVSAVPKSQARCHVRWYKEDLITASRIPSPYNRDGCANFWYLCSHVINRDGQEFWERLNAPPAGLNQGWDPLENTVRSPLKGLDLFCGGGNFGRGLAEGGAVEMTHAIDWNPNAVASYRANEPRGEEASVYCGSVNDYLLQALQGHKNHQKYASIHDIDFIAAGSPCQGFSRLNQNQSSPWFLRNISMVASVAAFIDFYRPKYALLENVVTMAESDVFPQLLCCLVGMGYQVSTSMIEAWSHGSPQARPRGFIHVSAPGLVPQQPPELTHSHPPEYLKSRSLGKCHANDNKFGERKFTDVPFKFVSASEAMDDLPWIGDGRLQTCISHPDHRNVQVESTRYRQLISHIPVNPPGSSTKRARSSAILAIQDSIVPQSIGKWYLSKRSKRKSGKSSSAYSRVDGKRLTSVITTSTNQADANNGRVLHWSQHRILTILEARRAQGFPDDEVIVGSKYEQWKIVGNSVARTVALALGVTLREAWLSSPEHEVPRTCTPVSLPRWSSCPILASTPATPERVASAKPKSKNSKSTIPIRQQTVESTLSMKQSSTSRETRTTLYMQNTLELSQKTTTHTVVSVPSSSSTEAAVKLEDEKKVEIVDLGSDTETEEPSSDETQSTTSLDDETSGSNGISIIELSDDTADSERPVAFKRKSRSSSSELSHDAAAKRPKKEPEEPTIIDLTEPTDESSA